MGVVSTQIVEDDGHVFGKLEVEIALVVRCAAIFAREMIVVANLILSQCIAANVTVRARREALLIRLRHFHRLLIPIDFGNLPNFLLHALHEFLGRILPAVDDRCLVIAVGILYAIAEARWSM